MSVFAPTLSSLWRQIEDHGINPGPLFEKHGIAAAARFDPNARVSYVKSDRIMAEGVQLTGDAFFGLKEAEYFLSTHIGPLGFAWLASTSLRSALNRLQRYIKVIHEKMELGFQENEGVLVITMDADIASEDAYQRDCSCLSVLTKMCRFIYGEDWNPLKVTVAYPPPQDSSYFFSLFRCPVEFNADGNSIHISSEQADERLSGANRQLAQLNDHIVVRYLAGLDRDDIVNRVKTVILESLGEGGVTETAVAESLHTSTRNLHRKLASENTSFKNLLLEIRTELASQYINDRSLSLTEISYMLGFSEISAFSRAYRRWTGGSPSEARKTQLGKSAN
jgi:AraC-like DNA-binding protein